jgi:hypothetical protein
MRLLRKFKGRFDRTSAKPAKQRATIPIKHPVLGSLIPHKIFPESLSGWVQYGPDQIDLLVSPDNRTIEAALKLAASLVELLQQIDLKCRDLIADEFLERYNSGWRFGEVAQQDGTFEPFEKPLLTRRQFCENLKIKSIVASGDSLIGVHYDDSDMFWGHSLEVTSFDGTAFGDTHTSMFG